MFNPDFTFNPDFSDIEYLYYCSSFNQLICTSKGGMKSDNRYKCGFVLNFVIIALS